MTRNIGTDDGAMPANVSDSARATVTAGLAKLVELVTQYAPTIHPATANATTSERPDRTQPWITSSRPRVATISDNHRAGEDRSAVASWTAGSSNMMFATTAP